MKKKKKEVEVKKEEPHYQYSIYLDFFLSQKWWSGV